MKLGFSTLALFMQSFKEMLETAEKDKFELLEILCEGPYWPRHLLENSREEWNIFESYDTTIFIHSPTIDLNPASLNPGIREETKKQLMETVDLAVEIGAETITTHPGMIHRQDEFVRKYALEHSMETLRKCTEYAHDRGVKFSIENMPYKYSFLGNNALEHKMMIEKCGSGATVDMGHANTTGKPEDFFKIKNISYYHLSDNNGKKDQHLPLGDGILDLKLLNNIEKGIIELNNYEGVLKSRDRLNTISV